MNVVVLAGGLSPEREVSLTSGSLVANALMSRGHRVLLLDAYLGMEVTGDPISLFRSEGEYTHQVSAAFPDLDALKRESGNGERLIGKNVIELCCAADVVYIAMHGGMGEDGRLQSLLDCYGVRYTGTCALGAALSMDKDVAKQLMRHAGILTPDWIVVSAADTEAATVRALREIGLPCVVKPCSCGSSAGVSMVESEEELRAALVSAAAFEERIMIEKTIVGRELTVGILGGRPLPPVEIIPKEGFYDYANKYQGGRTVELCPAPLTEEQTVRVQARTAHAFEILRLSAYARFDFIMDAEGEMWCLEANALPGMTPTSLLPQEAAEIGLDYPSLCEEVLRLSGV